MSQDTVYRFDWDPAKASSNQRDHGISFDRAATVFLDPHALTVYDVISSQGEDRWFTLGCDVNGRLLAVAHSFEEIEVWPGQSAHHLGAQGNPARATEL